METYPLPHGSSPEILATIGILTGVPIYERADDHQRAGDSP